MTRISLVEAYDDKDVITQIAKIKDKLDSIPDDADLSNCVLKVNNQIIDGRKTFNDVIVANDGIAVTGDLNVDGNIVQSGVAVEVHVEEVYTKNDYITMREDAATAIPPGQFSGLQIVKYNGVDDGRMVMDDSGIMRVGDVGDEKPLMVRDESGDLTDGDSLVWDAINLKAVTEAVPSAIATALSGKEDTIASGTLSILTPGSGVSIMHASVSHYGKIIMVGVEFLTSAAISPGNTILSVDAGYVPIQDEWFEIENVTDATSHSGTLQTDGTVVATTALVSGKYHIMRLTYLIQ